jgi:hypothetical protein
MPNATLSIVTCGLIAALGACGDGTGPAPHSGFYLLTDANGQPPPVLVGATTTCDQFLQKTGISLVDDGTFSLSAQVVSDCRRSGGSISMAIVTLDGTYRATAGHLSLVPAGTGAPRIAGSYDATHLWATIPASPQTFPIPLDSRFLFYPAPPP